MALFGMSQLERAQLIGLVDSVNKLAQSLTEQATTLRSHMQSCDQRADKSERTAQEYRQTVSTQITALDGKLENQSNRLNEKMSSMGKWIVRLVLTSLCFVIVQCLIVIAFFIEHFIIK